MFSGRNYAGDQRFDKLRDQYESLPEVKEPKISLRLFTPIPYFNRYFFPPQVSFKKRNKIFKKLLKLFFAFTFWKARPAHNIKGVFFEKHRFVALTFSLRRRNVTSLPDFHFIFIPNPRKSAPGIKIVKTVFIVIITIAKI